MYIAKILRIASVLFFSLFFMNCDNNSETDISTIKGANSFKEAANMEYLDVDVSDPLKLTEKQKAIVEKAKTRIDSYIMYDKKLKIYRFKKIAKGEEIQMSERLFEYFKTQMNKSNELLNELKNSKDFYLLQDIKDSKRLHVFKNKNVFKIRNYGVARIQSEDPEGVHPPNSTGVDIGWCSIDLYISHGDLEAINSGATLTGVFAQLIPHPAIRTAVSVCAGFVAWEAGDLAHDYPNGVIIEVEMTTWGPTITTRPQPRL